MFTTQVRLPSGKSIVSLALLGGLTLSAGASSVAPVAHAAPALARTWLTVDGPWLCRVWSNNQPGSANATNLAVQGRVSASEERGGGSTAAAMDASMDGTTIHCTQKWHVDGSLRLISDMPWWTPNPSGEWPAPDGSTSDISHEQLLAMFRELAAATPQPTHHVATVKPPRTHQPPAPTGGNNGGGTGGGNNGQYNPWGPVPGHPSYGMSDFQGDPWSQYFGVCTWYAWYRHQSEPLLKMGNASSWPWKAASYGLHTGSMPVAGATVIFQPGVEGAYSGGHAGHVEQVLGNGWFIISEMNFGINGGGWGRVDYRYAYVAPGVSFIY